MKNRKSVIALVLTVVLLFISAFPVAAADSTVVTDWKSKVSDELISAMETMEDDDVIPVCIWLNDIGHEMITKALIEEKGMDPAIYEDEELFESVIVSEIEDQLVSRVGYEATHSAVDALTDEYTLDDDEGFHDSSMSLLDRARLAKANEYLMAHREITKREHSSFNDIFLEKYVNDTKNVISVGRYITRIVVKASRSEIMSYAVLDEVRDISVFEDELGHSDMSIAVDQVGAGYSGTKSSPKERYKIKLTSRRNLL